MYQKLLSFADPSCHVHLGPQIFRHLQSSFFVRLNKAFQIHKITLWSSHFQNLVANPSKAMTGWVLEPWVQHQMLGFFPDDALPGIDFSSCLFLVRFAFHNEMHAQLDLGQKTNLAAKGHSTSALKKALGCFQLDCLTVTQTNITAVP